MLGLQYDEGIDIGSLGCIIADLILGLYLYPGSSEYDLMRRILRTHGVYPARILDVAPKADKFFKLEDGGTWRLKVCNFLFSCQIVILKFKRESAHHFIIVHLIY